MTLYKFLNLNNGNLYSIHNYLAKWKIGKWYNTFKKLKICKTGYHCSEKIFHAFSYSGSYYLIQPIIAIVETKGKSIMELGKQCWQKMRIIEAYKWNLEDSINTLLYVLERINKNINCKIKSEIKELKRFYQTETILHHNTLFEISEKIISCLNKKTLGITALAHLDTIVYDVSYFPIKDIPNFIGFLMGKVMDVNPEKYIKIENDIEKFMLKQLSKIKRKGMISAKTNIKSFSWFKST